jgi:hypothetical protein
LLPTYFSFDWAIDLVSVVPSREKM